MIEVFPTANEQHIAKLFREINAAEPVRMIDLPEELMQEERLLQMQLEDEDLDEQIAVGEEVEETVIGTPSGNNPAGDVSTAPSMVINATATVLPSTPTPPPTAKKPRSKKATVTSTSTPVDTATPAVNIRDIITESVDYFRTKYPEMFKPTARCKVPHMNVDVLRDDLYNSPLFMASSSISSSSKKAKKIQQASDLIALLEEKNRQLEEKYVGMLNRPEELALYNKSFKAAIVKAQQQKFFLGMDKQWLENM